MSTATRKDIDDILAVLDVMMTRIDERFSQTEKGITSLQSKLSAITLKNTAILSGRY